MPEVVLLDAVRVSGGLFSMLGVPMGTGSPSGGSSKPLKLTTMAVRVLEKMTMTTNADLIRYVVENNLRL